MDSVMKVPIRSDDRDNTLEYYWLCPTCKNRVGGYVLEHHSKTAKPTAGLLDVADGGLDIQIVIVGDMLVVELGYVFHFLLRVFGL